MPVSGETTMHEMCANCGEIANFFASSSFHLPSSMISSSKTLKFLVHPHSKSTNRLGLRELAKGFFLSSSFAKFGYAELCGSHKKKKKVKMRRPRVVKQIGLVNFFERKHDFWAGKQASSA
jgi:hypothetical protein